MHEDVRVIDRLRQSSDRCLVAILPARIVSHLFYDVRLQLTEGEVAVTVGVGLPAEPVQDVVSKEAVAALVVRTCGFVGAGGRDT
jgi:hypothetical protein